MRNSLATNSVQGVCKEGPSNLGRQISGKSIFNLFLCINSATLSENSSFSGPIKSSLHVFTNPESMKPEFFPWNLVVCFDLFSMIFHLMSGSCQLDRASNVEIGVEY